MPKKKTHSGASKRFKKVKSGKVKYTQAGRRKHLTKKTAKRKRRLRKSAYFTGRDSIKISSLME